MTLTPPLHGGGQGFGSLRLRLLTWLCLCSLASEYEVGVPLGYGKHFDTYTRSALTIKRFS
jgi:hypothetical protein